MTAHPEARGAVDPVDAVELVEMLGFIAEWCAERSEEVSDSLERFVGVGGYDADDLAADARRLALSIEEAGR